MNKIYLLLAEGFEELEAFAPVDLLRRAGAAVETVSITSDLKVMGARGIAALADITLADLDYEAMDLLILPGGYPGYENLGKSAAVKELVFKAAEDQKTIAAICGAPSILGEWGLLEGQMATCYPGMEDTLGCAIGEGAVVQSGNFITSRGAGTAIDFALALVSEAVSAQKAEELRKGIVYQ